MLFETVERLDVALIAQSGEPCNAEVDPDGAGCRWQRLRNFPLRLNRRKPFFASSRDSDVTQLAEYVATFAIAQPAEFVEKRMAVAVIELDLFRLGV
jgi:hypothetical protein